MYINLAQYSLQPVTKICHLEGIKCMYTGMKVFNSMKNYFFFFRIIFYVKIDFSYSMFFFYRCLITLYKILGKFC